MANQNQYGNQGGNWGPPPNQQQYNQNQGGGNWNPPPNQQQYPPQQQQQQQYNQNQGGGNWNAPPNNGNQNQQNTGGNWQQQQPEQQRLQQGQRTDQTWQNDPQVTVTQQGNTTITETTQSGGGKDKTFEFAGPQQFGPGNVDSSGPYQPVNDQEQIDYFRLKLWESSCMCCANFNHPCLNMWIWALFWLIIFIFNGLVNLIGYLGRMGGDYSGQGYSIIALFITIASLCINVFAVYGMFKCKPLAFALQLVFFLLLFLLVVVGFFFYPFQGGYLFMSVLFIVCDVWAFWVIRRVYGWAKWFRKGGRYDPVMYQPE